MFNIRSRIAAAGMAAAIAAGTLAAVPAEAGIAQAPAVLSGGGSGTSMVQDVAWKKYPHRWHGHHGGGNNNWVGPLVGGMVLGGILAAPYYGGYGYAPAPRYRYSNHDAYCHARFRSYNSATGFYLGYDGHYHRC
jgi:hypothetical protein